MRRPTGLLLGVLLGTLLGGPSGPLVGQEARTVPLWDPVYEDVDRLADAGLLPGHPVGQRPWSVAYLRSAAASARSALEAGRMEGPARAWLAEVVGRVESRVAADPGPLSVPDALFEAAFGGGAVRSTPDNGQGSLDDRVAPLAAYRTGRGIPGDALLVVEPSVVWAPSDRLAFEIRPRARVGSAAGGDTDRTAIAALQVRARLGPLALAVGRGDVVWGDGRDRSLMLSGNARALDRIELSTDRPLSLGFLGPGRFTAFLADLGSDRVRAHAKLLGARLSVRPVPRLELGWSYLNEQGGEGAPGATVWERIADVLVVPDLFRSRGDFEFSEKLMGGDLRWWIPGSPGVEIFVEGALTDFDVGRVGSLIVDDASWRGGVELPRVGGRGAGWLRLTGTRTGLRWYRHTQFPSGLTLDGAVVGSALGPDGRGVELAGGVEDGGGRRWEGALAWESRSADVYGFQPDGDPVFPRVEDRTEEVRLRARAGVAVPFRPVRIEVDAGVERVRAFAFRPGDERTATFLALRGVWTSR